MDVKSSWIQMLDSSARESKSARFCQALTRAWQIHVSRPGSVVQSSARTARCDRRRRLTRRPCKLSTEPVFESRRSDRGVAGRHEHALFKLAAEIARLRICNH